MTIRIDGTNTTANPGITGGDADTGLQFGTDEVKIVTGGSDRVTVDNSGQVGIGITPAVNLDVSGEIRTSTGILFGTDTAAVNTLNDYEEGTFTPIYQPATGAFTSITYDSNVSGNYTKIGNICYVKIYLRTDALTIGTASGNLYIGGLPFTPDTTTNGAALTVGFGSSWAGEIPSVMITRSDGSAAGALYYRTDGGTPPSDVSDLDNTPNDNTLYVSGFYDVD